MPECSPLTSDQLLTPQLHCVARVSPQDSDGSTFEGEFKDAKRHGRGTITHADGRTEAAEYVEGKRVAVLTASQRARMRQVKESSAAILSTNGDSVMRSASAGSPAA